MRFAFGDWPLRPCMHTRVCGPEGGVHAYLLAACHAHTRSPALPRWRVGAQEGKTPHDSRFRARWDDGDTPLWLGTKQLVLAERIPLAEELTSGMHVLALYNGLCSTNGGEGEEDEEESDVWFPAKVVGKARGKPRADGTTSLSLQWDDGNEAFTAPCHELRTFLSHTHPLKVRAGKAGKPRAP